MKENMQKKKPKTDKNFRMDHTTKVMLIMTFDREKRKQFKNLAIDSIIAKNSKARSNKVEKYKDDEE